MALKLNSSGGGSVTLDAPVTANNYTLTAPASSGTIATTDGGNTTFTSITDSGNLTFTGTGNRIIGDFSGSGFTRLGFISSVTGATSPTIIANATYASGGAAAALTFYNQNDENNGTFGQFLSATTEVRLVAGAYGTGTYLPMTFYTGGSERMRIDTSGNVGIGFSSVASPTRLQVANANIGSLGVSGNLMVTTTDSQGTNVGGVIGIGGSVSTANPTTSMRLFGAIKGAKDNASDGDTSGYLSFYTMGSYTTTPTERMRINSSGNMIIGAASSDLSDSRLSVIGASTVAAFLKSSDSTGSTYPVIMRNSSGTNTFFVRGDGAINLGLVYSNWTSSGTANAFLASDGYIYRSTSSLKYKREVNDAVHGLKELLTLRPVTYKGKAECDGDTVFGGLIAEEVHEAGLTEFVQYAEDGTPDALSYSNMVSLCIKAIQELKAELDDLKSKVGA